MLTSELQLVLCRSMALMWFTQIAGLRRSPCLLTTLTPTLWTSRCLKWMDGGCFLVYVKGWFEPLNRVQGALGTNGSVGVGFITAGIIRLCVFLFFLPAF